MSVPTWYASRALRRAVLLTGLLTIAAVVLGRVDLVVFATPFAVGAVWGLRHRRGAVPVVEVAAGAPDAVASGAPTVEGGPAAGLISVANSDQTGLDLVVVRTSTSEWLDLPGADRPHVVAVPPGEVADLELTGVARRWGRHRFGPVGMTASTGDGLLVATVPGAATAAVKAYPVTEPFEAPEAMPRAAGLVGSHRSRRPGEGGELSGVRRYAPGDRLRRIDWRVSLRTRQLHVVATLSDRDAEVVLVLDLLAEAGRPGGVPGAGETGASVLDVTVRAAAAVAEHYLQRGDRVSLVEYGPAGRRLRPASGRRQYLTILEWLLDVRPSGAMEPTYEQVLAPLPPNALVVVLTPVVDRRTAPMLARLARAGRFVVAVDTLPADIPPIHSGRDGDAPYRLWRLERENTIGALREHGVPVVAWAGAGSLDRVLRDVARAAAAPRVGFS